MKTFLIPGTAAGSADYRLFILKNALDMTVTISERGAAIRSWRAPDRYGRMADVLQAGLDGAPGGAQTAYWQGRAADDGVALTLAAPNGSGDYFVHYHLDDDGRLTVDCHGIADFLMPYDVTLQPYFNLNGGNADIGDHMLQIDAEFYVEVDGGGAPAGVAAVAGTAFDFREPAAIGSRLRWTDTQIGLAGGFDHGFFVRNHFAGGQGALREVARVVDPGTGRRLHVSTTESSLQFCSGKQMAGAPGAGLYGPYRRRHGFSLEAHARPDLMSPVWPQVILHPGQVYRQTTVYQLSVQ